VAVRELDQLRAEGPLSAVALATLVDQRAMNASRSKGTIEVASEWRSSGADRSLDRRFKASGQA
jgi:hypothetical protein